MDEVTIMLPRSPTRPQLRAFALVSGAGAGVSLAGAVALAGWPLGAGLALAIGAGWGIMGWIRPRRVRAVYERWNGAAHFCARAGGYWTSAVLYYVLLTLVGRGGSRLPWSARAEDASGWRPRQAARASDPYRAYASQHRGRGADSRDWPSSLRSWAREADNVWAWGLLPLLALLRIFRPRIRSSLGEHIYTLF